MKVSSDLNIHTDPGTLSTTLRSIELRGVVQKESNDQLLPPLVSRIVADLTALWSDNPAPACDGLPIRPTNLGTAPEIWSPLHAWGIMALIWIGMFFFPIISALAQAENELTLTLSRDFGYSSGTGRIQGTFSIKVRGPDDLQRVVFLIDGQPLGEDDQAPFSIQFHTGDYSLGTHTLSAVGYTSDGRELGSNEIRQEFVTADEGGRAALRIAGPIIGVTFGIILLSTLLPIILGRRKGPGIPLGAPRTYGILGGTVCPKCHRPFGMHIWGLNMLAGKLDRCPYCGKWSLVKRVSLEELKAAEAAELELAAASDSALPHSAEDTLQKELDDSRFLDL